MSLSVVIAGGGTGGHLYPGLAVARALQARLPDAVVTFVGTAAGIEARVIPREGFPLALIRSAGLKGKSLAAVLRAVPTALRASAMALSIFSIHVFGDLWSPPLVGRIADHVPIEFAMMILPIAIAASAFLWWPRRRPSS